MDEFMNLKLTKDSDKFDHDRILKDNFVKISEEFAERSVSIRWFQSAGISDTEALELAIATGKYVFIPEEDFIIDKGVDTSRVWGFGTLDILGSGPEPVFNPLRTTDNYSNYQIEKFLRDADNYAAFAADAKNSSERLEGITLESIYKSDSAIEISREIEIGFNRIVAEAGSNNPEVVLARGDYTNLNMRLDDLSSDIDGGMFGDTNAGVEVDGGDF